MTTINGIGHNQVATQAATKKSNTKQVVKGIVIGAAAAATVAVAVKHRKPIGEAAKKAINTIKEAFTKQKIDTITEGVKTKTEEIIREVKTVGKDAFEKIKKVSIDTLESVKNAGTETINAISGAIIGEGIKKGLQVATDFAKNILTNASKYAGKAWTATKTFVTNIIHKVVEFIKGFGKTTGTGAI